MKTLERMAVGSVFLVMTSMVFSQQLIIYPADGQTPEQQQKDQAECRVWAALTPPMNPAIGLSRSRSIA